MLIRPAGLSGQGYRIALASDLPRNAVAILTIKVRLSLWQVTTCFKENRLYRRMPDGIDLPLATNVN